MKGVIATSRVWIVSAIALGFWSEKESKQETKSLKIDLQLKTAVGKTAGSGFV